MKIAAIRFEEMVLPIYLPGPHLSHRGRRAGA
jgi:hypothetical protein